MFYRAWGALLTWVNEQRAVVPRFPRPTPNHPIAPELVDPIRDVVWAEDDLRAQFLAEAAGDLGAAERDLIASWKHRVSGKFILLKHLQKHSIFISKDVYGVLGLYTPFPAMFPAVPMFVEAVLLPFGNSIITDGLLKSPPMQISFGAGARRSFNDQYSEARATSGIRTSLVAAASARPSTLLPARTKVPSRTKATSISPDQGFAGTWRITESDLWDQDALDAVEPAFIQFGADRLGGFAMIVIQAAIDCRYATRDGKPLVEFTFEGDDDGHPCIGRGWGTIEDNGTLRGHFFIHRGDDSGFVAERLAASTLARATRSRRKRR